MKRVVARNREQIAMWYEEMLNDFEKVGALMIEWDKHKIPHSRKQQKRFYAMVRDIALFTGNTDVKHDLKQTDIWPREEVEHTRFFADGSTATYTTMAPKSEADLSKEEETLIIELLFMIGSNLPGFAWSDPAMRRTA